MIITCVGSVVRLIMLLGFAGISGTSVGVAKLQLGTQKPSSIYSVILRDTHGHRRSLDRYGGQVMAVHFFCGCAACHEMATVWANALDSLPADKKGGGKLHQRPVTIVVFSGSVGEAKSFLKETRLSSHRVVLLFDNSRTAASAFGVTTCPRSFVANAAGAIVFASEAESGGTTNISLALAGALDAVRACDSASSAVRP
jgi:hypothetical protein